MIYLNKFVLDIAKEKELKLHDHTKSGIRDAEREMEKNREIEASVVIGKLQKKEDLKKGFDADDWKKIEKEIKKMLA